MNFVYNDGDRKEAGFKGGTNDCVCRSISIATSKSYREVYDAPNELAKSERTGQRKRRNHLPELECTRTPLENI